MRHLVALVVLMLAGIATAADFGDLLKGLGDLATPAQKTGNGANLSNQDVSHGLKDALIEGAVAAVGNLGRIDGFLKNDQVRIPLPSSLQKAESVLKVMGQGKRVDELKTSLNRAAEAAVPEAKTLLVDAVKNMTLDDAKGILKGGEDSATQYFRKVTGAKLHDRFRPIVEGTVNRYQLSQQYDRIAGTAARAGLIGKEQASMSEYVTGKALDGLFYMIGEEEKAIRRDPLGRSSEYIRKVFGSLK